MFVTKQNFLHNTIFLCTIFNVKYAIIYMHGHIQTRAYEHQRVQDSLHVLFLKRLIAAI